MFCWSFVFFFLFYVIFIYDKNKEDTHNDYRLQYTGRQESVKQIKTSSSKSQTPYQCKTDLSHKGINYMAVTEAT